MVWQLSMLHPDGNTRLPEVNILEALSFRACMLCLYENRIRLHSEQFLKVCGLSSFLPRLGFGAWLDISAWLDILACPKVRMRWIDRNHKSYIYAAIATNSKNNQEQQKESPDVLAKFKTKDPGEKLALSGLEAKF